jgi:hypothetical protein
MRRALMISCHYFDACPDSCLQGQIGICAAARNGPGSPEKQMPRADTDALHQCADELNAKSGNIRNMDTKPGARIERLAAAA